MSKHTPGPWVAEGLDVTATHQRQRIARCDLEPDEYISSEETRANALLVAAAPDMVEALKQIAQPIPTPPDTKGYRGYVHHYSQDSGKRIEIARNALRKAGVKWGQP